uniref:Glutamate--cysteine ligase n=1 Tax=Scenedesmus acutus TaxID=104103 RepID=A0A7T3FA08_9CHLO|nr:gamma-glutamylcysteine synthetase [Scenedesmus acutus]
MQSLSGPKGLRSTFVNSYNGAHPRTFSSSLPKLSSHVVAANAPSEGSTEPVSRQDLIEHLRSGCKTRDRWRIGTEHEKLGFNLADNTRMDYEHIKGVFERLQSRFGWEPMTEAGLTIGVKLDGQSVTLEPGGQFELSGAPLTTLHQTCAEVNSHLYQSKTIGEELGIGFLGVGFDPKWSIEQIPVMPKDRYRLMKAYMPTVGTRGLDMMFRTCTIQVNLDFESEQDMIEKFRIGLALQPIAVALFANSPFVEGKPTGFLSTRGDVWTDVDAARTGNLPFVFEPDMSFEKYVDYAMDVPMYFVYRKGQYINALGQSWRDFMEGKLPALPGQRPTMGDWENHLTTIFPEVRLKKFLEMRGADGGPWRMICALPALWVGLIYEPQAQAEALDLISSWSQDDRDYLRNEVPRLGLATPFKGGTVQDVALKVLAIAQGGLDRRGYDEGHFLKQLHVIAESGMSPASHLLQLYGSSWGHSVDPLFKEFMY